MRNAYDTVSIHQLHTLGGVGVRALLVLRQRSVVRSPRPERVRPAESGQWTPDRSGSRPVTTRATERSSLGDAPLLYVLTLEVERLGEGLAPLVRLLGDCTVLYTLCHHTVGCCAVRETCSRHTRVTTQTESSDSAQSAPAPLWGRCTRG